MSTEHIEVEGQVIDSCKGILIVEDGAGNQIRTRLSGKMRLNKIMVTVGDRVQVKVSPYDLQNGFIIKRM